MKTTTQHAVTLLLCLVPFSWESARGFVPSVHSLGRPILTTTSKGASLEEEEEDYPNSKEEEEEYLSKAAQVWQATFAMLEEYCKEHGHANVPKNYKKNPGLGGWVHAMRTDPNLTPKQKAQLADVGFQWDAVEEVEEEEGNKIDLLAHELEMRLQELEGEKNWRKNQFKAEEIWLSYFERLKGFDRVHGHCLVPELWQDDTSLAMWVDKQRQLYATEALHPYRIDKLKSLGFVWDEPYARLLEEKLGAEAALEDIQKAWDRSTLEEAEENGDEGCFQ